MVGKVEMLKVKQKLQHWKYKELDLRPILYKEPADESITSTKQVEQDHGINRSWTASSLARPPGAGGKGAHQQYLQHPEYRPGGGRYAVQ